MIVEPACLSYQNSVVSFETLEVTELIDFIKRYNLAVRVFVINATVIIS